VASSRRLVKLLELLHAKGGMEAAELAQTCGISPRTLQRDLDALTAAGFPVYFDHGYRLAMPALLPAIPLTVDEALALRLAAQAALPRTEAVAARALSLASDKLQQALAATPPSISPDRQLALALPWDEPHLETIQATLAGAIADRRSVKLADASAARRGAGSRRVDPYRLLPEAGGAILLAYCHDRRRILRIPLSGVREVTVMRRRFRPIPARLLERHLHRALPGTAGLDWVRIAVRPPLAQTLRKHPPVGALTWEDGPEGSVTFTVAALRSHDLVPWLLACGDAVEVLEPAVLRQEVHRIAQAVVARHGPLVPPPAGAGQSHPDRPPRPAPKLPS
jgi:predicted DNA-binding transcriptional regulator YafY